MNVKHMKKTMIIGGAAALLAGVLPNATLTAKAADLEVNAEASITVDVNTGQLLQGDNVDTPLGIASMSKMLVEYIVFEELEAGNLSWDDEITISQYAYEISQDYALSNVALRNSGVYTLEELYEAMAIYSANGATIAIAEHIEGTEPAFVDRMIETAESFGIEDAQLFNSTGLNNSALGGRIYPGSSETDENMMSARSAAIIANRILEDYPEILEISSIPEKTFREGTVDAIHMTNWNWMLEGLAYERENVDGLKTGTTTFAGSTFTGTAEENGRRLITVVLDSGEDGETRFVETDKMMDFGFDEWDTAEVTEGWEQGIEYAPLEVINGTEEEVGFEPSETLEMLLHMDDTLEEDITYTIEWNPAIVTEEGAIEAPFDAGMEIGELVMTYTGNDLGHLEEETRHAVPVVTTAGVEKANIFVQAWNWLSNMFDSILSRF